MKIKKIVAVVIIVAMALVTIFAVGYRIGYDMMEKAIQQTEKAK